MRFVSSVVAVVLSLSLSGCSFLLVNPPHATAPPSEPDDCTESNGAPAIDATIAAIGAVVAVVGVAFLARGTFADCSDENEGCSETAGEFSNIGAVFAVAGAVPAATFGASAYTGFGRVERCRQRNAGFSR